MIALGVRVGFKNNTQFWIPSVFLDNRFLHWCDKGSGQKKPITKLLLNS